MTAVIYARTSSSGSMENRQNTERQVRDLQEYAKYQKYDVVKVYEEHISGAKKNSERAILQEAIDYCITNNVDILLSSELSRIGRSSFEVLETVKKLIDNKVNLYLQKEQMTLLNEKGEPSMFAPILISCLSFSYFVERESVQYRLNSGRRVFIEKGGKLGRKKGSIKSIEKKEQEYKEVLMYLRKGYGVRVTSKLTNVSESTVQRLKKEFAI